MSSPISLDFLPQEVMSLLTNIVSDCELSKVYQLLSSYNEKPTYELRNKCECAVQTLINNVINTKCSYQFVSNLPTTVTLVMLAPGGAPTILTVLDSIVGSAVTTIYLPNDMTIDFPDNFKNYLTFQSANVGNNLLLSKVSPNTPAIYTDFNGINLYSNNTFNYHNPSANIGFFPFSNSYIYETCNYGQYTFFAYWALPQVV